LVVYKSEGKLPDFLYQAIQQFKALLNWPGDAFVFNGEHDGGLYRHLQGAGKAQAKSFDLLVIGHVALEISTPRPRAAQTPV
jgi:hypothetical protein